MTAENFPSWELWAWKLGGGCTDKSCFLQAWALGLSAITCGFGERKHHLTLLLPKTGILETVLEWIGRIGSFLHPMYQLGEMKNGNLFLSMSPRRSSERMGRAHGSTLVISCMLGCHMPGPGSLGLTEGSKKRSPQSPLTWSVRAHWKFKNTFFL